MNRLLRISAGVLAFLAAAGLVAAVAAVIATADRGGEGEVSQYDGGEIVGTPVPATIDHDAYIEEIPNPAKPMPKLTESQLDDVRAAVNSDENMKAHQGGRVCRSRFVPDFG